MFPPLLPLFDLAEVGAPVTPAPATPTGLAVVGLAVVGDGLGLLMECASPQPSFEDDELPHSSNLYPQASFELLELDPH